MNLIYGVLIFFGDSLTYGSRDPTGLSFPVIVARMLSDGSNQKWTSVNLGVPGETTADMLRRSYSQVKKYPEATDLFLLAGTNDARNKTETKLFRDNYLDLIRDFGIIGKRVFCLTIPTKTGFGSPGYEWDVNWRIKEYNKTIREVSDRYIELENLEKKCFIDGVHFSHVGNQEVAKRIINKLKQVR